MNDLIRDALNEVGANEDGAFDALLAAVRTSIPSEDEESLRSLFGSEESMLRRVAVQVARERETPDCEESLRTLAGDTASGVRIVVASALRHSDWWSDWDTLKMLLSDWDEDVRKAALIAADGYAEATNSICEILRNDDEWAIREKAAQLLTDREMSDGMRVSRALLNSLANDSDEDVRAAVAISLNSRLNDSASLLDSTEISSPREMKDATRHAEEARNGNRRLTGLITWLSNWCDSHYDIDALSAYGRVLTRDGELRELARGFHIEKAVATILEMIDGPAPKSVVLTGASGSGKTTIIHEVARALADRDPQWCCVEIPPAGFLSGTKYIGEWETRLDRIVAEVSSPKRVLLHVPNIHELATIGKGTRRDGSVGSALAPLIERGKVVLIGESNEKSLDTAIKAEPVLKRLLKILRVDEPSRTVTESIVRQIVCDAELIMETRQIDRLMELAEFYQSSSVNPGRTVDLLRPVLDQARRDDIIQIEDEHLLKSVASSSRVVRELVDDRMPLPPLRVSEFLSERVIGQKEAVQAATDLITMIKARLVDPRRPLGVQLFVGPTGVGKTELARSIAEFCFGDAERIVRIDLSEYASYDAYERLLGKSDQPGTLTAPVQRQPFSVVLLDEFEKAHLNVFDLCLQLFDAGRLTDSHGETVDFRRCIVLLTSNSGSSLDAARNVGFGRSDDDTLAANIRRELKTRFRPEFLNRLDRVVHFHPLDREAVRKIVRREISAALQRNGITSRHLDVAIEDELIDHVGRVGYSREFGARPIKRAVEQRILLPLAQQIATDLPAEGTRLRLSTDPSRDLTTVFVESDALPIQAKATPAVARRSLDPASNSARTTS